ncbi:MAG: 3-phosphoshikimate 1-carboxyvinyltransferase [Kiritimatiellae bacterium]|nr:3-phosphoshikimate 1-carboxyvinyltransferase [Kiritimatiellia bacterium]
MTKTIAPRSRPLIGSYRPEGDKSLSHRALLFASLAEGESTIRRFLIGGVTRAMLRCLKALGVEWTLDEAQHILKVKGVGLKGFKTPTEPLDCGNSATTFRLLAGAVAGAGVACVLDGSEGLRKRPMARIIDPLRMLGAEIESPNQCAPLTFKPATITSLNYALPIASAQVKSCLLLAALSGNAPTAILEPGPSRDHTERMLAAMGARVKNFSEGYGAVVLPQAEPLKPLDTELAGDISSAAFLMVAATLLPGSDFLLEKVGINPTRTGIVDALRAMGADITFENETEMAGEPVADIRIRAVDTLHATTIQGDLVVRMIDEFPAFMIAAACATGDTVVREAAELRTKESDRIAIMAANLQKLGVAIEEYPDGFRISGTGKIPGGATVSAHGDHRIAMSMALASLRAEAPVSIENFEMLNESFPDFPRVLDL